MNFVWPDQHAAEEVELLTQHDAPHAAHAEALGHDLGGRRESLAVRAAHGRAGRRGLAWRNRGVP